MATGLLQVLRRHIDEHPQGILVNLVAGTTQEGIIDLDLRMHLLDLPTRQIGTVIAPLLLG